MHITDRITKEMKTHETETGRKCWAIYLGRNEMDELLAWGNEDNQFDADDLEGRKRPQYQGALVYRVNDDVHLNVG